MTAPSSLLLFPFSHVCNHWSIFYQRQTQFWANNSDISEIWWQYGLVVLFIQLKIYKVLSTTCDFSTSTSITFVLWWLQLLFKPVAFIEFSPCLSGHEWRALHLISTRPRKDCRSPFNLLDILIDHSYLLSLRLRGQIPASHVVSSGTLLRLALLPPLVKAVAPKEESSIATFYVLNVPPPKFISYRYVRSSRDD